MFAIAFVILTKDSPEVQETYFPSVWVGMWKMILMAAVPDLQDPTEEICLTSIITAFIWVGFIFLVHLTMLNMLVGVLVEVIGVVSTVERETIDITYIRDNLMELIAKAD